MVKTKAVVAMSGGVDSSVAAALMVEQGYEVLGVTLKLLPRLESGFGCCGSPADIDDARRVAEKLGIPHYTLDLSETFEEQVILPFVAAYRSGRTPNPCVECNRGLKFGRLLSLCGTFGAEILATGHYARVKRGRLLRPKDLDKDQTYFLYSLTSEQLRRTQFPLGELTKPEVRAKAKALGLNVAEKPESQEICFVPRRDYRGFLASRDSEPQRPGPIRDVSGRQLGTHQGLRSYTVGQRKRLGINSSEARYVTRIEPETNTLFVGSDHETHQAGFEADRVSWTGLEPLGTVEALVRIRHRHSPAPARLTPLGEGRWNIAFDQSQRAVTPGQSAVFYRDDEVLGGGTIS